ncbi:hypothetical protein AB0N23_17700 [Streptomyces sp. NPDC052644]
MVLTAFMVEPDGPWDHQAATNAAVAAGVALALAAVTAVFSRLAVKAAWLRTWWYVVPTVLAVAAILRLTVLAPET